VITGGWHDRNNHSIDNQCDTILDGGDVSEHRTPQIILTRKVLPQSTCNKMVKIELFIADQFRQNWTPCDTRFDPPVPLKTKSRKKYWNRLYRVRINGQWWGKAKYTMITESAAARLLREGNNV